MTKFRFDGVLGGTRTHCLTLRRRTLYPGELQGRVQTLLYTILPLPAMISRPEGNMNWKNFFLMLVVITAGILTFFMDVRPLVKVLNITICAFGAMVLAETLHVKK